MSYCRTNSYLRLLNTDYYFFDIQVKCLTLEQGSRTNKICITSTTKQRDTNKLIILQNIKAIQTPYHQACICISLYINYHKFITKKRSKTEKGKQNNATIVDAVKQFWQQMMRSYLHRQVVNKMSEQTTERHRIAATNQ